MPVFIFLFFWHLKMPVFTFLVFFPKSQVPVPNPWTDFFFKHCLQNIHQSLPWPNTGKNIVPHPSAPWELHHPSPRVRPTTSIRRHPKQTHLYSPIYNEPHTLSAQNPESPMKFSKSCSNENYSCGFGPSHISHTARALQNSTHMVTIA